MASRLNLPVNHQNTTFGRLSMQPTPRLAAEPVEGSRKVFLMDLNEQADKDFSRRPAQGLAAAARPTSSREARRRRRTALVPGPSERAPGAQPGTQGDPRRRY